MFFVTLLLIGLPGIVPDSLAHVSKNISRAVLLKSGVVKTPLEHQVKELKKLVYHLNSKVSTQDLLLQQAYGFIRQQGSKLAQQQRTIRHQGRHVQFLLSNHTSHPTVDPSSVSQPVTDDDSSIESSVPNRVGVRSDDSGRLEVIVLEMGQKISGMLADIQALKSSDERVKGAPASTFIRWGSSQCGNFSQLVYSGVIGGSHESHPGGSAEYLCLTLSPVPSNHTVLGSVSLLFGGEFETYDTHQNKDPLCSVCRTSYATTIMIPGTNVCAPGWHMEYSGFLMTGYYGFPGPSEFICVDPKFESRVGGDRDANGKLLYFTVTRCGSLPCEPYENNRVVSCAVCSK